MPHEATDHDLLVTLNVKLDQLSTDMKDVKSSVREKAEAVHVEKLETRVDETQRKLYMITGGLVVIEGLFRFIGK